MQSKDVQLRAIEDGKSGFILDMGVEVVLTGHLVLRQKVLSGEAGAAGAG